MITIAGNIDGRLIEFGRHLKKKYKDIPSVLLCHDESIFQDEKVLLEAQPIFDQLFCCLGFGPFVFKACDGREISRAANLHALEQQILNVSQEVFANHCNRNDFSRWFYARAEVELADKVRPINQNTFSTVDNRRRNLLRLIRKLRTERQKGLVVNFEPSTMEMNADILKYDGFPPARVLKDLLEMGQEAMGCPVEIEFS